jgi:hypothetical protein
MKKYKYFNLFLLERKKTLNIEILDLQSELDVINNILDNNLNLKQIKSEFRDIYDTLTEDYDADKCEDDYDI